MLAFLSLLVSCTPTSHPTVDATVGATPTVDHASTPSATVTPALNQSRPAIIGPGRLNVTSGDPIQPGRAISERFVYTKLGSFPIALRADLAPDVVERLSKAVEAGEYGGQPLAKLSENFVGVHPKTPWAQVFVSKNRVAAAEGLVFVDPKGTLGFTIGSPVKVPDAWVCVGQLQIPSGLLELWDKQEASLDTVNQIGNPTN